MVSRVCRCKRIIPANRTRCDPCEAEHQQQHNAQPNRRAHWTPEYKRLRKQVLAESDGLCHWDCGQLATECDFVIPLSQGGTMTRENAVAACKSCNSARGGALKWA